MVLFSNIEVRLTFDFYCRTANFYLFIDYGKIDNVICVLTVGHDFFNDSSENVLKAITIGDYSSVV